MGYILYARYRLRLPLLKIQESLSDLHDFQLSRPLSKPHPTR